MKKGFTLIELLAVIVILAIIALIATPIILGIIEDSRRQSAIDSAELYVDGLSKYIANKNQTTEFMPSRCVVGDTVACDNVAIDYKVGGEKPISGYINYNNGLITDYSVCIMRYKVDKTSSGITATKDSNCTSSSQSTTYAACTLGELVQYDPVNNAACTTGETCYKWRVITTNDTTTNDTITLQLDHNLVNLSAWVLGTDYNDNENWWGGNTDKGPITALKALETATTSWDDSLKLNYSYDTSAARNNYGTLSCTNGTCTVAGGTITTNLKARMITGEEVKAITVAAGAAEGTNAYNWAITNENYDTGSYYFSSSTYILGTQTSGAGSTDLSWLVENTIANPDSDSGATANTYGDTNSGYWTLSPYSGLSSYAWYVNNYGNFSNVYVDVDSNFGIRPVITIPKFNGICN